MPTLAVTETCLPPTWNGSWKAADDAAGDRLDHRAGRRRPPAGRRTRRRRVARAGRPYARCCVSRCTTARNSTSPASWPSVSFTVLNRSRSSNSSAIFRVTTQCARRRALELIAQVLPVRNAGQRVVTREVVELDLRALALDGVADGAQNDAPVALPLDEIVLHAAVENFDGVVLVTVAAQHHDRHRACRLAESSRRTRRREPSGRWRSSNTTSKRSLSQRAQRVADASGARDVDGAVVPRERYAQEIGVVGIILDQQDLHSRNRSRRAPHVSAVRET